MGLLIGDLRNRDMSDERNAIRICLPFKDHTGANAVKKQMTDLSRKVGINLKPIFTSRKLEEHLRHTGYVGYTVRHLHQRIVEHRSSTIGKHLKDAHGNRDLLYEYRDLFTDMAVRNNRSELAIANRHQGR